VGAVVTRLGLTLGVLLLAVSGAAAQLLTIPGSCEPPQPCACSGSTCWPTERIGAIRITGGITFDCSHPGASGYLGGLNSGSPTGGPIVEIVGAGVTLKNCLVQYGTLYGIWAHDTQIP
jgi:hypothetical protein